ncbi:MAG: type II secretion system F family protein [Candidatus Eremiobacteraeota bacterium]|nr:type II secretion system F family protein [Candidatus Eremiobacteraeota bacterium]
MARERTRQERFKQRDKTMTPQEELKAQIQGLFGRGEHRYRVSGEDLTIFTRQLATMLGSGIPLHQALTYYGETSEGDLPEIIRKVAMDVASGHTFSNAMRAFPKVFNSIYIALAQMGEQSGQIITAYKRMADLMERQTNMKKRVISALTYPCVLFVVSMAAIAGFVYFVLPMMTPMFENSGVALPLPTRILMSSRTVVPILTIITFIAVVGGWLGKPWISRYFRERPEVQRKIHAIPFHIPVVAGIYSKISTARVLYSMCTMLDSGLTMTSTIKRSAAAAGNEYVAHRLNQANERIMEGASLGEALSIYQVFPSGAIQMLTVGEEAANLTDMVRHVADMYDSEVELALNDIASILEPMIMVVMGLIVGFIVLSAVLPTVQLIQSL